MAHSGRADRADGCPLWGEQRTWRGRDAMSAHDPKQTLRSLTCKKDLAP